MEKIKMTNEKTDLEKIVVFCDNLEPGKTVNGIRKFEVREATDFIKFIEGKLNTSVEEADYIVLAAYTEMPKLNPHIAKKTLFVSCDCFAGNYEGGTFIPCEPEQRAFGLDEWRDNPDTLSKVHYTGLANPNMLLCYCDHGTKAHEVTERYVLNNPKFMTALIERSKK